MKILDFQKQLGVTPAEYKPFTGQLKGPGNGLKNETYAPAHRFFTQEESGGHALKSPVSKKQKIESESNDSKDQSTTGKNAKAKNKDDDSTNTEDLPKLNGEDNGSVPVYDTCSDVRTKIDAHLKKHRVTKKAFADEISKCQPAGETAVTPAQVSAFQKKNGLLAGNSTKVFYASYVYFEKFRTKEGKDRSKKRKEMEDVY